MGLVVSNFLRKFGGRSFLFVVRNVYITYTDIICMYIYIFFYFVTQMIIVISDYTFIYIYFL